MLTVPEYADMQSTPSNQESQHANFQRLHAFYLAASGQACHRAEVAALVGMDSTRLGRWFVTYQQGGFPAILDVADFPGTPVPLAPAPPVHL
ncbi:MAG: hypothetical protein KatS3mg057_0218 [Herpetosiphonaceae bacterium]|nr:MAG: hypothetical protein KatS3mg057_0218 [Herpetosiphonaceae bacterium]